MTKYINLEDAKTFLRSRRYTKEEGSGHVLALSPTVIDELDALPTIDPFEEIDRMINAMIEKAEEHKINKRLDLARNTLDIVYAFRELKKHLSLTQK